jgi:hypothetical protein
MTTRRNRGYAYSCSGEMCVLETATASNKKSQIQVVFVRRAVDLRTMHSLRGISFYSRVNLTSELSLQQSERLD